MVNSTEVVVHYTVIVPETTDVMRQLILQDRYVTYREIETILGISRTSIHSILPEHFTVNKIYSRWIPHNLSIAQKKAPWRLIKRNAFKHVYDIVTDDKS